MLVCVCVSLNLSYRCDQRALISKRQGSPLMRRTVYISLNMRLCYWELCFASLIGSINYWFLKFCHNPFLETTLHWNLKCSREASVIYPTGLPNLKCSWQHSLTPWSLVTTSWFCFRYCQSLSWSAGTFLLWLGSPVDCEVRGAGGLLFQLMPVHLGSANSANSPSKFFFLNSQTDISIFVMHLRILWRSHTW